MKRMIATTMAMLLAMVLLNGCIVAGNRVPARSGTLGQELLDLQRAKDAGILTEADYQKQRLKLMNQ